MADTVISRFYVLRGHKGSLLCPACPLMGIHGYEHEYKQGRDEPGAARLQDHGRAQAFRGGSGPGIAGQVGYGAMAEHALQADQPGLAGLDGFLVRKKSPAKMSRAFFEQTLTFISGCRKPQWSCRGRG